jgi:beta-phosphoglucomutase-like phosphatase (HAD superfamily)
VSAAPALSHVEVLLCDADGNLFPSEEPAFVASAAVTNRLLEGLGVERRFAPDELRLRAMGRNFRATALDLAAEHAAELAPEDLDRWVAEEKAEVTEFLARTLEPDARVTGPLTRLARHYALAAVSSSALARLDACFRATGLEELFPPDARLSAEDSLPVAASKPDPAIYAEAVRRLGVPAGRGLAVEDAVPGVQSAAGAGLPVVGNLLYAPAAEREERREALREAGALAVVDSWEELEELLNR